MQAMILLSRCVFAHGHDINRAVRARREVDHRSRGDTDLRSWRIAPPVIGGRLSSSQQADMPVLLSGVSVDGIDAVMLCCHIEHIVSDRTRKTNSGYIERLCVDLAIDWKIEAKTKGRGLHIPKRKEWLGQGLSCSLVVVMPRQHIRLCERSMHADERKNQ